MMSILKQHRGLLLILALAALLFTSDIWAYKEFVRAESYFALGARLMVEQGDWLMPHAPDEQPLNKPPLTYWLIGICYRLFGVSYGSARLPSVFGALATLVVVYAIGIRFFGKPAALISAAILATSFLFTSFARMAMSDMLLTTFVTISMACLITVLTSKTHTNALVLIGFASVALGVLAKGPLAIGLIALPIAFEWMCSGRLSNFRRLRIIPGLALFSLIAAPYFLLVYARAGAAPLRFFFLAENLQRFTGQVYSAAARPFWYEPVAFFSDFAPWSLLVPIIVIGDLIARQTEFGRDRSKRILYLWLGSTIALFSFSSFKLDYYLLPAMPAAALTVGRVIANTERLGTMTTRFIQGFLIIACLLVFIAAIFSNKAAIQLQSATSLRFLPVVVAGVGLVIVGVNVGRRRLWAASISLCATIAATFLSIQLALLPSCIHYLPAARLVATVPGDRNWFTDQSTNDWANDFAFNLPPPHSVQRLIGEEENARLLDMLKDDDHAVAVVYEREYEYLVKRDPELRVLAQAETYGHGGFTLRLLRRPLRQRLLVIGH